MSFAPTYFFRRHLSIISVGTCECGLPTSNTASLDQLDVLHALRIPQCICGNSNSATVAELLPGHTAPCLCLLLWTQLPERKACSASLLRDGHVKTIGDDIIRLLGFGARSYQVERQGQQ